MPLLDALSRRAFGAALIASFAASQVRAQEKLSHSSVDALPSWRDGAIKSAILNFLDATTTDGSPDHVPPSERTVVFDNDGTLWSEQPIYPEVVFAADRLHALVSQHPDWAGREPYRSALAGDMDALAQGGLHDIAAIVLAAQGDTTLEAFHGMVSDWIHTARHPRFERLYTECVYQPMLEVLALFLARGFHVWIATGSSLEFMRPWAPVVYGVPIDHLIGTTLKLRYEMHDGRGELLQLSQLGAFDDGPGKPAAIASALGRRPLAAFGNSDGDYEMLQYVTSGGGRSLGVIVHHDDADREYAYDGESNIGRLDRALGDAAVNGWHVVSMRKDWGKVFPDR